MLAWEQSSTFTTRSRRDYADFDELDDEEFVLDEEDEEDEDYIVSEGDEEEEEDYDYSYDEEE